MDKHVHTESRASVGKEACHQGETEKGETQWKLIEVKHTGEVSKIEETKKVETQDGSCVTEEDRKEEEPRSKRKDVDEKRKKREDGGEGGEGGEGGFDESDRENSGTPGGGEEDADEAESADEDDGGGGDDDEVAGDDDDDDDGDDEVPAELQPHQCFIEAKRLAKKGSLDEALTYFGAACRRKAAELKKERHWELAPFYLEYGNALLQKGELENDIFKLDNSNSVTARVLKTRVKKSRSNVLEELNKLGQKPPSGSSVSRGANADSLASLKSLYQKVTSQLNSDGKEEFEGKGEVAEKKEQDEGLPLSDEELAWETLELARLCFEDGLKEIDEKQTLPPPLPGGNSEVSLPIQLDGAVVRFTEDAAFCHLRLGDILMLHEQFEEAARDFQSCLEVLKRLKQKPWVLAPATIALAQAHLFSKKSQAAIEAFTEAMQLVRQQLREDVLSADTKKNLLETEEDLRIQIRCLQLEMQQKTQVSEAKKELPASMSPSEVVGKENPNEAKSVVDFGSFGRRAKKEEAPSSGNVETRTRQLAKKRKLEEIAAADDTKAGISAAQDLEVSPA